MNKVSVLGGGNIGSFVAHTLGKEKDLEVTITDTRRIELPGTKTCTADISNTSIRRDVIAQADIIVNALPGFLGFDALLEALKQGKHIVDISFMTEDPRKLDELAKKNNATAVVDFGFAPGMCHMMVGNAMKKLGKAERCVIAVGGLPKEEKDEYKVVFSAEDVLQEYTRPARLRRNGEILVELPFNKDYMLSIELPSGKKIMLSGFMNDGLRTMVDVDIPDLAEITLRYPKHFEKMKALKEDGFFKKENLENTVKVLAEKWKRSDKDRDMSILQVSAQGGENTVFYSMYDEYDEKAGVHSMARVTGYPIICMVKMIASGEFSQRGVILPEVLGQDEEVFQKIMTFLKDKGISIKETMNNV